MSEQQPNGNAVAATAEVRTRRLVIVGQDDVELAVMASSQGVVELRLGEGRSGIPCSATVHAGQPEPGTYAAGIELWANGNSVAGFVVTITGDQVEVHHFE